MATPTMTDNIKTLLGITDQDALIGLYINKAITLISNYLMLQDDTVVIPIDYTDAVMEYVVYCMNRRGNEGLKQFAQGSRSGTYGSDLPDSVIMLLPAPYAKLIQTTLAPAGVILP